MVEPLAERLTIDHLGARGDGVAREAHGPVFVERALPGEVVLAEVHGDRGRLLAIETPSPERVAPFCGHYDDCGGCGTQHMAPALYTHWKTTALAAQLARAGITGDSSVPLAPMIDASGTGRRRVTLHGRAIGGKAQVGFMAPRSHDLIDIDRCPVLTPELALAPEVAHQITRLLLRFNKPLDIQITASLAGLDVDIRGLGAKNLGKAEAATRLALVEAATRLDLARLSLHGDVLVERRPPLQAMGRATVAPPPGGFLQATQAGEETLGSLVCEAMTAVKGLKVKKVADCFAGCGPFTLRLAEIAEVSAYELDAPALAALDKARRATQGLRPVSITQRDLFRRPLLPLEINTFDAIVLDPPRAGAEALVRQIAASRIRLVVSVSCDAGTFARDAALLMEAGFAPMRIVPVDQFRHTAHIEIVGIFARAKNPS